MEVLKVTVRKKKKSSIVSLGKRKVGTRRAVSSWLKSAHTQHTIDTRPLWGEPAENWRPSGMNSTCDRYSILKVLGYRNDPISYDLQRIFDMGKLVEDYWRLQFRSMGILLSANVRVERDFPPLVRGEYDAMVRHPYESDRIFVVEIKSIADALWKQLPTPNMDPTQNIVNLRSIGLRILRNRMMGYLNQLQMYQLMTYQEEGILLMDNKDNQKVKDYYITSDPQITDAILARHQRLEPYRVAQLVPACTCHPDARKGMCTYLPDEEIALEMMKERFSDEDGSDRFGGRGTGDTDTRGEDSGTGSFWLEECGGGSEEVFRIEGMAEADEAEGLF